MGKRRPSGPLVRDRRQGEQLTSRTVPADPLGDRLQVPGDAGLEPVRCASLLEAVARAVREVRPLADRTGVDGLTSELEARICAYWGTNHGMTTAEMIATARDVKTSAASNGSD